MNIYKIPILLALTAECWLQRIWWLKLRW